MTETWLRPDDIIPIPPNYIFYRNDRCDRGGGVAILCRDNLKSQLVLIDQQRWKQPTSLEIICVNVQVKMNKSIDIVCVYRTKHLKNDLSNIEKLMHFMSSRSRPCVLIGDFNINVKLKHSASDTLIANANRHMFNQTVNFNTRGDSIIDLIFINQQDNIKHKTTVSDEIISDHFMQTIQLNVHRKVTSKPKSIEIKDYQSADWDTIQDYFIANENNYTSIDDANNLSLKLTETMKYFYDCAVPGKLVICKNGQHQIQLSPKTKRLKDIRDYHLTQFQSTRWQWHKDKIKFYEKLIKQNTCDDVKHTIQQLVEKAGLWKTFNREIKLNFKSPIQTIVNVNADLINKYYCTMGFPPNAEVKNTLDDSIITSMPSNNLFTVSLVNQSDLMVAWKSVRRKLSKKCDTTGISKMFLDMLIGLPAFNCILLHFVNLSFRDGIVPNNLKIARVVPIPKVDGAKEASQFRPISLTANLLLLLEKVYHNKLINFLDENKILSPAQFGCRKNHSTELAITATTDIIMKTIDKGWIAVLVSIDLRKAFDSVNKEKLLQKIKIKYGISDFWLRDYLKGRKQFVAIDDMHSKVMDHLIGLPAGSVLGGALFALFLNDLPQVVINGTTIMFVDDSNFIFCGSPATLKNIEFVINEDMKSVCKYFGENELIINSDKTKMITLSSNRKREFLTEFSFEIDGHIIKNSQYLKCLGITFDNTLSWSHHVGAVAKTCYIRIRALYTIRQYLSSHQLQQLCQCFVLSIVNYMIHVYGVATDTVLNCVNKVVRTLARLVLNVKKFDPIAEKMYSELNWLLPVDACAYKSICNVFKLGKINNTDYFSEYFRKTGSERRDDFVSHFRPRNEIGRKVFQHRAMTLWNELPSEVKKIDSYNVFRNKVKQHIISKFSEKRNFA